MVTVVLESNGFAELLERTEDKHRVSDQDSRIITLVRKAKTEATATAKRLADLEERQQKVMAVVEQRRNEVVAIKGRLLDRRRSYAGARDLGGRSLRGPPWHPLRPHSRSPPGRGRPRARR